MKIATHILAATVLLGLGAGTVSAACTDNLGFCNPLAADSIEGLLSAVLQLVARLGAIVAVLYFIYGGFLYVTAQGDENAIAKAHSTLKWAAVGTAVILGAEVLARIIQGTVSSLTN